MISDTGDIQLLTNNTESIKKGSRKNSKVNRVYRALTVGAVAIEPGYSYFLWLSVVEAAEFAIQQFGGEVTPAVTKYIKYIAAPFVFANLLGDLTCVDPLRDADEFTAAYENEKLGISKQLVGIFLKLLAVILSFPMGASADAISIAALTEEIDNNTVKNVLNYSALTLVTLLGVVYYIMFTNTKIQKHVNEFIDTLKSPKEFSKNFINNPGGYLEVFIQTIFNSFYRSIYFSYVLSDVISTIFRSNNKSKTSRGFIITTAVATFITTIFSRTLSVKNQFVDEDYSLLTLLERNKASRFRAEQLVDFFLTLIRANAVSMLIFQFLPASIQPIYKSMIANTAGALIAMHSWTVRRIAGVNRAALKEISIEELAQRRQVVKQVTDKKTDMNFTENSSLLVQSESEKSTMQQVAEEFDEIAKHFNSKTMDSAIDVVNVIGRLARFVGFFLFISGINEVFDLNLKALEIIALTFLWGAEVFKSDGAIYKESMQIAWTGMAAKAEIEKMKNINQNSLVCGLKGLAKSPYDYSLEELRMTSQLIRSGRNMEIKAKKNSQTKKEEEEEIKLDHSLHL